LKIMKLTTGLLVVLAFVAFSNAKAKPQSVSAKVHVSVGGAGGEVAKGTSQRHRQCSSQGAFCPIQGIDCCSGLICKFSIGRCVRCQSEGAACFEDTCCGEMQCSGETGHKTCSAYQLAAKGPALATKGPAPVQ